MNVKISLHTTGPGADGDMAGGSRSAVSSTGRFYGIVAAVIVLLALTTTAVIGQGPRLRVELAVAGLPDDVSSRPRIRLAFGHDVSPESVGAHLHISPSVPFAVAPVERRGLTRAVDIILGSALQSSTTYTLTLSPGVTTRSGHTLSGSASWHFTTRPPRLAFMAIPADNAGQVSLQVADLAGTTQQLSGPGQAVQSFGVAHDGSLVVYGVRNSLNGTESFNLWRAQPGGLRPEPMTDASGVIHHSPRWSPAGDLIAYELQRFVSVEGQERLSDPTIGLMRPDGTPLGLLSESGVEAGHSPVWSPDGTKLAFFDPLANAVTIFNFTRDMQRLPGEYNAVGSWSPDGRKMITTYIQQASTQAREVLSIYDLDIGPEWIIAEAEGQMQHPTWSPTGEWIAYVHQPTDPVADGSALVIVRPDGSERTVLLQTPGLLLVNPAWSPAGDWLAFTQINSARGESPPELWVIRSDGRGLRRISSGAYLPQWIP